MTYSYMNVYVIYINIYIYIIHGKSIWTSTKACNWGRFILPISAKTQDGLLLSLPRCRRLTAVWSESHHRLHVQLRVLWKVWDCSSDGALAVSDRSSNTTHPAGIGCTYFVISQTIPSLPLLYHLFIGKVIQHSAGTTLTFSRSLVCCWRSPKATKVGRRSSGRWACGPTSPVAPRTRPGWAFYYSQIPLFDSVGWKKKLDSGEVGRSFLVDLVGSVHVRPSFRRGCWDEDPQSV